MARSDFLSINTAVTSLEMLRHEEFNIALAYDLDFRMPSVIFENGVPKLEELDGYDVCVISEFMNDEWDNTCVAFVRDRLMCKDLGPRMPIPMLVTAYSCNFNKLPCSHQIKRFGDWLNANDKKYGHYIFNLKVVGKKIYYQSIDMNFGKPYYRPVKKAMALLNDGGVLRKGFVASVSVYDKDLHYIDSHAVIDMNIKQAYMLLYDELQTIYDKSFIYRTDGGHIESMLHAKIHYSRRTINGAENPV